MNVLFPVTVKLWRKFTNVVVVFIRRPFNCEHGSDSELVDGNPGCRGLGSVVGVITFRCLGY